MSRKYDALFIFSGGVKEDAAGKCVEKMVAEIEKLGGKIEASEVIGRRQFARTMGRRDSGVYAKVRFAIEPEQIVPLRARYALDEDCFRVQITLCDERIEAAKAADDLRRAAHKAKMEQKEAAAAAEKEITAEEETAPEEA